METYAKRLWLARQGIEYDEIPAGRHSRMWNMTSAEERDGARAEISQVLDEHTAKVLTEADKGPSDADDDGPVSDHGAAQDPMPWNGR